jgi:hypothetical protein
MFFLIRGLMDRGHLIGLSTPQANLGAAIHKRRRSHLIRALPHLLPLLEPGLVNLSDLRPPVQQSLVRLAYV